MTALDVAATTRLDVEDFLYAEAALLDDWRLDEWLGLVTEDVRYTIPAVDDPTGDPESSLPLVDDDIVRLRARVVRLQSPKAHREYPRGRTRRIISNVRVVARQADELSVECSFVVYRFRRRAVHTFVGRYRYVLVETANGLRIRRRRAELDLEALDPHGTVAFIL